MAGTFENRKNVTRYDSTTEDFLKARAGVCQDFTHLIGSLANGSCCIQIASMPTVQARAVHLDRSRIFGVPIVGFENAGRQQFIFLLMCGLEPQSKILDIGCGVLRAAYWLILFLD